VRTGRGLIKERKDGTNSQRMDQERDRWCRQAEQGSRRGQVVRTSRELIKQRTDQGEDRK